MKTIINLFDYYYFKFLLFNLYVLFHVLHSVGERVENTPDGALSWSSFSVCAC